MKLMPIQITVRGSGEFPIDMLRYDGCFPLSEGDARLIRDSFDGFAKKRTVVLLRPHGYKHWQPSFKRWKSFGWEVVEAVERKDV